MGKSTLVNRLVADAWHAPFKVHDVALPHDAFRLQGRVAERGERGADGSERGGDVDAVVDGARVDGEDEFFTTEAERAVTSRRQQRRLRHMERAAAGDRVDEGSGARGGDVDGAMAQLLAHPFYSAVEFDAASAASRRAVASPVPPFVTTSPLPGTTLRTVAVPFVLTSRLHDTPGVVLDDAKQQLFEQLARDGGASTVSQVLLLRRKKVRGGPSPRRVRAVPRC